MFNHKKSNLFFYKYYGIFYILFFLFTGIIIWLLLSGKRTELLENRMINAEKRLLNCDCNCNDVIDTLNSSNKQDTVNREKPHNIKPCESKIKSGLQGIDKTYVELGQNSGSVTINYDMLDQPDKLEVYYENKRIVSTFEVRNNENGFVGNHNRAGGVGVLKFNYVFNHDDFVKIVVTAPSEAPNGLTQFHVQNNIIIKT